MIFLVDDKSERVPENSPYSSMGSRGSREHPAGSSTEVAAAAARSGVVAIGDPKEPRVVVPTFIEG